MSTIYHAAVPVNLAAPSMQRIGTAQLFYGDNNSHVFTALVADTDEPEAGLRAGTVSGAALRADGVTVALEGTKGNSVQAVTFAGGVTAEATPCSVTLPQAALAVPGSLLISIKLTEGTTSTTVLAITGTVIRTETDAAVDPGEILPDLASLQAAAAEALDAAQDARDAGAAAVLAAGDVVLVQDEEPQEEITKIWIPETSATEVVVPTYSELQDMAQNVAVVQDEEPVSLNTKLWIPASSAQETQVPTYSEFQDLRDYMHHLEGKRCVCLGDSITYLGYTGAMETATGMTVTNCGFSSARMAKTSATSGFYSIVNYFAFFQLAASIASNDWTIPDQLNSESGFETQKIQLAALKQVDFSAVDYVTIAYGTNDFASAIPLDNPNDPEDYTTYKGAIRYGVKQLLTAYPHLKILGVTAPYQFWESGGVFVDDCTTHLVGGRLKSAYIQATMEGFADMFLPYVDNYYAGGINFPNHLSYFIATDGTHPDQRGRDHIGRRIASAILLNY